MKVLFKILLLLFCPLLLIAQDLPQSLLNEQKGDVEKFWEKNKKTPLLEKIDNDPDQIKVTFLWKGDKKTKNVVICGTLWDNCEEDQLIQIPKTDIWYKTCVIDNDLRGRYFFSPNAQSGEEVWEKRHPDPLNPLQFLLPLSEDENFIFSQLEMPNASPQPWIQSRTDVPKGKVDSYEFSSKILGNKRMFRIYTPPGYSPKNKPYNLLILFDGWAYTELVPTATILDNLIAEGKIPPLVAVLVGNAQGARNKELPCYKPFSEFLVKEMLPLIQKNYHVTRNPLETVIAGSSFGGLAATYAALNYPEVFGNVLSQSGAYWWKPDNEKDYEWLTKQYEKSKTLPIRFYLDAGKQEGRGDVSILSTNHHLRDLLLKKGYKVHFAEFNGGHDYLSWRGTLSDGLIILLND